MLIHKQYILLFLKLINFIFCMRRAFITAHGLSLFAASGATLCCREQAYCSGFSCCRAQALGTQASVVVVHELSSCGSWVLERRLSSCGAWA